MKALARFFGFGKSPAQTLAEQKRERERILRANGCSRREARRIVAQTLGTTRGRDGQ